MGALEWTALGVLVAIISTIGGIVVRMTDRMNKAEAKADAAESQAELARLSVAANRLEIDRMENSLVEHRVAVAKEYVSKDTLASLESRIVEAINRLGDRLDRMFTTNQHS
jgi:hypothetical protein